MARFISMGLITGPWFSSRSHHHDHEEICLYLSGVGTAWIGTREIPFQPGTLIRFPPGLPHRERAPGGASLYFFSTDERTPLKGEPQVLQVAPDGPVRRTLDLMHAIHLAGGSQRMSVLQHLYEAVEAQLVVQVQPDDGPAPKRLRRIITDGFRDPGFSLAEAMSALPMSPDHLRRRFTELVGTTPVRFLTRLRIEAAKTLLRQQGMPVRVAASQVGFTDPYYFSRVFTLVEGMSPSAWLRRG